MSSREQTPLRFLARTLIVLFSALLLLLIFAYGIMWILTRGPSPTARRLFVLSVKETSAGGFLADLYLTEDEIAAILSAEVHEDTRQTDPSLISLPHKEHKEGSVETPPDTGAEPDSAEPAETAASENAAHDTAVPEETSAAASDSGIEILEVKGQTYYGKLMIVSDPTRVFVGIPDGYGEGCSGLTVASMIQKYGCVAGTNAGGFYDPNGQGTGGIPDGIVIYNGELKWGSPSSSYSIAGLDADGLLHVGTMTAQHALDIGIRYAASYGPALVVNGVIAGGKSGLGGGLNPRTAIGQRADGAILLLVINGRSIDSLGATLDDTASVMLEHGAINATNLDGGSSSIMIHNGEYLTNSAYVFGERVVATAILVKAS